MVRDDKQKACMLFFIDILIQISMSVTHTLQRHGQAKYVPNGRVRDINKGSGVSSAASNAVGSGSEESEILSSKLAAASPEQQKQILGEQLYPLVEKHEV